MNHSSGDLTSGRVNLGELDLAAVATLQHWALAENAREIIAELEEPGDVLAGFQASL